MGCLCSFRDWLNANYPDLNDLVAMVNLTSHQTQHIGLDVAHSISEQIHQQMHEMGAMAGAMTLSDLRLAMYQSAQLGFCLGVGAVLTTHTRPPVKFDLRTTEDFKNEGTATP